MSEKTRDKTKPDWNVWQSRPYCQLWEAVALSNDINPKKLTELKTQKDRRYVGYPLRLKTARSNSGDNGRLHVQKDHPVAGEGQDGAGVELVHFVRFAKSQKKPWKVPPEFAALDSGATGERIDFASNQSTARTADSTNRQNKSAENSKAGQNAGNGLNSKRENNYLRLIRELLLGTIKGLDFNHGHKAAGEIRSWLAEQGSEFTLNEDTLADYIMKIKKLPPDR